MGNDDQARALAFAKLLKEKGMNTNHLATAFPHIGVNTILEVVIRDYVRTEKKKKGDHKGQMVPIEMSWLLVMALHSSH